MKNLIWKHITTAKSNFNVHEVGKDDALKS